MTTIDVKRYEEGACDPRPAIQAVGKYCDDEEYKELLTVRNLIGENFECIRWSNGHQTINAYLNAIPKKNAAAVNDGLNKWTNGKLDTTYQLQEFLFNGIVGCGLVTYFYSVFMLLRPEDSTERSRRGQKVTFLETVRDGLQAYDTPAIPAFNLSVWMATASLCVSIPLAIGIYYFVKNQAISQIESK